ncbi:hypothetical protein SAMN05216534_1578 [Candidatus Aquiluna sp. UB-MaderosW2red]|nr:hypothetical protein SAMN05216534_1578 [Candidatus Aquiluna sp. UB-MaderosW2red]
MGIASLVLFIALIPLWLIDPRTVQGVSTWEKPLKFFISTVIFSMTYSWLSSFITRGQRLVKWAGWVIFIAFSFELILITAVAAFAKTSHFNVSSPLEIVIWSLMAIFISAVLIATVVLSLLILGGRKQNYLVRLGLGLGSLNTAIGMALAFLMTSPTANQLANFQGIAGAHGVGAKDGGPGLPFLGWSTVAGDLRVGHFFGLHSIQVAIALVAIALILPIAARTPLLVIGNFAYLGFVIITVVQALRAESFSSPSETTITSFIALGSISALAFGGWNLAARRKA